MILVEYRNPDDPRGAAIVTARLKSLAEVRDLVTRIRENPRISDYAVIDEEGAPREIWARDESGQWRRDP